MHDSRAPRHPVSPDQRPEWSQIQCSSPEDGKGMHADVRAWGWFGDTTVRQGALAVANCPGPTHQGVRRLDDIGVDGTVD
jgi:hypothetical protein